MYAIIMGGGRVGLALANLLIDSGANKSKTPIITISAIPIIE